MWLSSAYCKSLIMLTFYVIERQDKFKESPVVLVTSEHLRTDKEYDAALIWTEDVSKDSFKVCLRELQNFDGKHEDISVVCDQKIYSLSIKAIADTPEAYQLSPQKFRAHSKILRHF